MEVGSVPTDVDAAVADFTKRILGIARKEGVDFNYIGPRSTQTDEVVATLKENVKVVNKLMKK